MVPVLSHCYIRPSRLFPYLEPANLVGQAFFIIMILKINFNAVSDLRKQLADYQNISIIVHLLAEVGSVRNGIKLSSN
jgi:hypothetical protein